MEIFEKRGRWCFFDRSGRIYRFESKAAAESAAGIEVPSLPLPEVREYDTLEEAIAEEE